MIVLLIHALCKAQAALFAMLCLMPQKPQAPFLSDREDVLLTRKHCVQALDCCVEIPQGGVVRSLNVHVSGAIAVYEYTRRHGFQSKASAA